MTFFLFKRSSPPSLHPGQPWSPAGPLGQVGLASVGVLSGLHLSFIPLNEVSYLIVRVRSGGLSSRLIRQQVLRHMSSVLGTCQVLT